MVKTIENVRKTGGQFMNTGDKAQDTFVLGKECFTTIRLPLNKEEDIR